VTAFAEWILATATIPRIDFLVLNAGVTGIGWGEVKRTKHPFLETRFAVNVVGNQRLVSLLAPKLLKKARDGSKSRVVVVSSRSMHFSPSWPIPIAHLPPQQTTATQGFPYIITDLFLRDLRLYGLTKLGNVLLATEIQRRWRGEIRAVSVHPGSSINTAGGGSAWLARLWLALVSPWSKTVAQGASTSLYGALHKALQGGEYLEDCQVSDNFHLEGKDQERAMDLWRYVETLIATIKPRSLLEAVVNGSLSMTPSELRRPQFPH